MTEIKRNYAIILDETDIDLDFYISDLLEGYGQDFIICGNSDYKVLTGNDDLEKAWKELDKVYYMKEALDKLAAILTMTTGCKWKKANMNGFVQSEWNYIIYNSEKISPTMLNEIHDLYYGDITELYIVLDCELEPDEINYRNTDGYHDFICNSECSYGVSKSDIIRLLSLPDNTMFLKERYATIKEWQVV